MRAYVVVFLSVFLAELGDKTQLATALFATDRGLSRWGVLVAASGALVVSTALAVTVGAWLSSWLPPRQLRLLAGILFVAIGAWLIVRG